MATVSVTVIMSLNLKVHELISVKQGVIIARKTRLTALERLPKSKLQKNKLGVGKVTLGD